MESETSRNITLSRLNSLEEVNQDQIPSKTFQLNYQLIYKNPSTKPECYITKEKTTYLTKETTFNSILEMLVTEETFSAQSFINKFDLYIEESSYLKPVSGNFKIGAFQTYKSKLIDLVEKSRQGKLLNSQQFQFLSQFFILSGQNKKKMSYPDNMILQILTFCLYNKQLIPTKLSNIIKYMATCNLQNQIEVGYFTFHKLFYQNSLREAFMPPLRVLIELLDQNSIEKPEQVIKQTYEKVAKISGLHIVEKRFLFYIINIFADLIEIYYRLHGQMNKQYKYKKLMEYIDSIRKRLKLKNSYLIFSYFLPEIRCLFYQIKSSDQTIDEQEVNYLFLTLKKISQLSSVELQQLFSTYLQNSKIILGIKEKPKAQLSYLLTFYEQITQNDNILCDQILNILAQGIQFKNMESIKIIEIQYIICILTIMSYKRVIFPKNILVKLSNCIKNLRDNKMKKQIIYIIITQIKNIKNNIDLNQEDYFDVIPIELIEQILDQGRIASLNTLIRSNVNLQKDKSEQYMTMLFKLMKQTQNRQVKFLSLKAYKRFKQFIQNNTTTQQIELNQRNFTSKLEMIQFYHEISSEQSLMISKKSYNEMIDILKSTQKTKDINQKIRKLILQTFSNLALKGQVMEKSLLEVILGIISRYQNLQELNISLNILNCLQLTKQLLNFLKKQIHLICSVIFLELDKKQEIKIGEMIKKSASEIVFKFCKQFHSLEDKEQIKKQLEIICQNIVKFFQIEQIPSIELKRNLLKILIIANRNNINMKIETINFCQKILKTNPTKDLEQIIYILIISYLKNTKTQIFGVQILLFLIDSTEIIDRSEVILKQLILAYMIKNKQITNTLLTQLFKDEIFIQIADYIDEILQSYCGFCQQNNIDLNDDIKLAFYKIIDEENNEKRQIVIKFLKKYSQIFYIGHRLKTIMEMEIKLSQEIQLKQNSLKIYLNCLKFQQKMKLKVEEDSKIDFFLVQLVLNSQISTQGRESCMKCLSLLPNKLKVEHIRDLCKYSDQAKDEDKESLFYIIYKYFISNYNRQMIEMNLQIWNFVEKNFDNSNLFSISIKIFEQGLPLGLLLSNQTIQKLKYLIIGNQSVEIRQKAIKILSICRENCNNKIKSLLEIENLIKRISLEVQENKNINQFLKLFNLVVRENLITIGIFNVIIKLSKNKNLIPNFISLIKKASQIKLPMNNAIINCIIELLKTSQSEQGLNQGLEMVIEVFKQQSYLSDSFIQVVEQKLQVALIKKSTKKILDKLLIITEIWTSKSNFIKFSLFVCLNKISQKWKQYSQKCLSIMKFCVENQIVIVDQNQKLIFQQIKTKYKFDDPSLKNYIKSNAFENNVSELISELQLYLTSEQKRIVLQQIKKYKLYSMQLTKQKENKIKLNYNTLLKNQGLIGRKISIVNQAIQQFTTKNGKTLSLRLTQVISLIVMNLGKCRKLLQISTGEGKSIIIASQSIIKAFEGYHVDILASSEELSERDSKYFKNLFALFNLSVSTNKDEVKQKPGPKICYKSDIVYGKIDNFQFDLLRHQYSFQNTRDNRKFEKSFAISDEIDSLLLDDYSKVAMLSSPVPGMSHLNNIFCYIWSLVIEAQRKFDVFNHPVMPIVFIKEEISRRLNQLIQKAEKYSQGQKEPPIIKIPYHLLSLVKHQKQKWIESALSARYEYSVNHHFIIIKQQSQVEKVCPIDFQNTGETQMNTSWGHGLHQFIQIKNNLRMSQYSLMTNYLSVKAYLDRYDEKIIGVSGTIGSESEVQIFKQVYQFKQYIIPRFMKRQFKLYDHIVIPLKQKLAKIIQKALYYSQKQQRVRNKQMSSLKKLIQFDSKVQENGGLHVILTFLPGNQRVQEQAFGRAARKGQKGSGQMIIGFSYFQSNSILDKLIQNRKIVELKKLEMFKQKELQILNVRDEIFKNFCNFKKKLFDKNKKVKNFKSILHHYEMRGVEEQWGYFLINLSYHETIESIKEKANLFFSQIQTKFNDQNSILNPYLYVLRGIELLNKKKQEAIKYAYDSFDRAIKMSKGFDVASAYYKRAQCYFKMPSKNKRLQTDLILKDLVKARQIIEQDYIFGLNSIIGFLRPEDVNSQLMNQVNYKIGLYKVTINNIMNEEGQIKKSQKMIDIWSNKQIYQNLSHQRAKQTIEILDKKNQLSQCQVQLNSLQWQQLSNIYKKSIKIKQKSDQNRITFSSIRLQLQKMTDKNALSALPRYILDTNTQTHQKMKFLFKKYQQFSNRNFSQLPNINVSLQFFIVSLQGLQKMLIQLYKNNQSQNVQFILKNTNSQNKYSLNHFIIQQQQSISFDQTKFEQIASTVSIYFPGINQTIAQIIIEKTQTNLPNLKLSYDKLTEEQVNRLCELYNRTSLIPKLTYIKVSKQFIFDIISQVKRNQIKIQRYGNISQKLSSIKQNIVSELKVLHDEGISTTFHISIVRKLTKVDILSLGLISTLAFAECLTGALSGGLTPFSISMISEGISDFIYVASAIYSGRFSRNQYLFQKGLSLMLCFASGGFSGAQNSLKLAGQNFGLLSNAGKAIFSNLEANGIRAATKIFDNIAIDQLNKQVLMSGSTRIAQGVCQRMIFTSMVSISSEVPIKIAEFFSESISKYLRNKLHFIQDNQKINRCLILDYISKSKTNFKLIIKSARSILKFKTELIRSVYIYLRTVLMINKTTSSVVSYLDCVKFIMSGYQMIKLWSIIDKITEQIQQKVQNMAMETDLQLVIGKIECKQEQKLVIIKQLRQSSLFDKENNLILKLDIKNTQILTKLDKKFHKKIQQSITQVKRAISFNFQIQKVELTEELAENLQNHFVEGFQKYVVNDLAILASNYMLSNVNLVNDKKQEQIRKKLLLRDLKQNRIDENTYITEAEKQWLIQQVQKKRNRHNSTQKTVDQSKKYLDQFKKKNTYSKCKIAIYQNGKLIQSGGNISSNQVLKIQRKQDGTYQIGDKLYKQHCSNCKKLQETFSDVYRNNQRLVNNINMNIKNDQLINRKLQQQITYQLNEINKAQIKTDQPASYSALNQKIIANNIMMKNQNNIKKINKEGTKEQNNQQNKSEQIQHLKQNSHQQSINTQQLQDLISELKALKPNSINLQPQANSTAISYIIGGVIINILDQLPPKIFQYVNKKWTYKMKFQYYASNMFGAYKWVVKEYQSLNLGEILVAQDDKIRKINSYTCKLSAASKFYVLCHEYVILEGSKNAYCLERQQDAIYFLKTSLQKKDKLKQSLFYQGQQKIRENIQLVDSIEIINGNCYLSSFVGLVKLQVDTPYNLFQCNCQHFSHKLRTSAKQKFTYVNCLENKEIVNKDVKENPKEHSMIMKQPNILGQQKIDKQIIQREEIESQQQKFEILL